jgi:formimidoylglutamate deiminase
MSIFLAKTALLPEGWAQDVQITANDQGWITDIQIGQAPYAEATLLNGPVIPGMPNLHSHAFQRAFAGQSEYASADKDSFWTWRKLMYDFMEALEADQLEDIAFNLYREMLTAGYTHVGEFHYIHHSPDGSPYPERTHLSHVMIKAAKKAGIGITLLPVLYAHSGFGGLAPTQGQRRFINTAAQYIDMLKALHDQYKNDPQVKIGAAFHSLRAVTPEMISEVCQAIAGIDADMPIHIHIAEQEQEVEDCLKWCGKRPVEWLLENVDIDPQWCLVHATQMTKEETVALARSGAVTGLCPTTEANLGDGLFNFSDYIALGGQWGIGSDSHISVNMREELRWLEYGQRLIRKERAIARTATQPHIGAYLYQSALKGGTQALGAPIGVLQTGHRADFLLLKAPNELKQANLLDAFIFAGNVDIERVYTGAKCVVD